MPVECTEAENGNSIINLDTVNAPPLAHQPLAYREEIERVAQHCAKLADTKAIMQEVKRYYEGATQRFLDEGIPEADLLDPDPVNDARGRALLRSAHVVKRIRDIKLEQAIAAGNA